MIEDKIRQLIIEAQKAKEELRAIKKSIRDEEKITSEEYLDLEKAYKDLRKQMKDFKDEWEQELLQENSYVQLKELKVKKDEEIGELNQEINESLSKLPPKAVDLQVETENGNIRIQIKPEMKLYLNGKEEKVKLV